MNNSITRGNCFKLLAACFYEPEKQLFLDEQVCANLAKLLEEFAPAAAKAAGEMNRAMETLTQEQLSIDHAALFIGPFELLAAPYGSVFKEKNRQVMGQTTAQVKKFYENAGLEVNEKEPPDHIAIELEFMHHLCLQEAEALSAGKHEEALNHRETQVLFFNSALGWVPDFCDAIRKGSENLFYLALSDCLERFIISISELYRTEQNLA